MGMPQDHSPSAERVRRYRRMMKAQAVQLWVSDTRSPAFATDAHRQSAAVAAGDRATDDQAFIDFLGLAGN
ncbi:MAG: DUF3018 family protein [Acidimicrobiia bacterium]|nr:DUF3018 family protein [Acidimicrobiia bacterium]